MILLDSVTKALEVVMSGAPATNQSPINATYVDHDATQDIYVPGARDTATNGTTAVVAAYAPGIDTTQRQIKLLNVYNADTAAITVTVRLNNNGTTRILVRITLDPGSTLFYTDGEGWRVITTSGTIL